MRKYLQTFKGNEDHIRLRRWGFSILTMLFALLVAMFNASNRTFANTMFDYTILALLFAIGVGVVLAFICDSLFGVARPSPLFQIKPSDVISYSELPSVSKVLTKEQIDNANEFYNSHKNHVTKIMAESNVAIDVSGSDKVNPQLWKPGHWLWFFNWQK